MPPHARMRIAFVYDALVPYLSGGAERRFHELATRLAERHDVHYVTWRFWGPEPTMRHDGVTYHGVGVPPAFYGHDGKRTIREAAAFALRLPRAIARIRPDIVDVSATPYLPLYTAWTSTRLLGAPLVATWHEFWGEHWTAYLPERRVVARIARLVEASARPLADRRVAVSSFTARRLAGAGQEGDRERGAEVDVVGNGVDVEAFASAEPDPLWSDIVYVGRLIDEKRVDLLVRAVAILAEVRPRLRCLVVGDGPERARLEALAMQQGVATRVRFLGRVPDERVAPLLRASRILVLPSIREGYGIAVVEGQAAGLVPVVVRGPLSAATDLVVDGVDGLVADPTPASLADAIGGLLADGRRLRRMMAAASRSAASRGWDAQASAMEAVYVRVLAERSRGRPPAVRPDARVAEEPE